MRDSKAGGRPAVARPAVASVVRTPAWPELGELSRLLLSPAEQARAAAFRDAADRQDFEGAHVLARLVAATAARVPASRLDLRQRCGQCGGAHGRPFFRGRPDLHVSLAHSRGAVLAVAGFGLVGADIESLRRPPARAALAATALSPAEQAVSAGQADPDAAFLRQWVRKEAMVKIGRGSLAALRQLDLGHLPAPARHEPEAVRTSLGPAWPGLHLLEQLDRAAGVVFAVVSAAPVALLPVAATLPGGWDGPRPETRPFASSSPAPGAVTGKLPRPDC